jgi:predicted RNA-binding Zn-ribbon protein involved in translation (DUF1610 family)
MDAWPMIEVGLRKQSELWGFWACQRCGHEVIPKDNLWVFDCGWCGDEAITPKYTTPQKDGSVKISAAAIDYADA